jgi:gluconate 5-dehydrogenase
MDTEANALDLFRLDGKSAIVTGGGRGLGQYMAEALSDAGANVVLCSRKKEALDEVKEGIEARGCRALALRCDVTHRSRRCRKRRLRDRKVLRDHRHPRQQQRGDVGAPPLEMPLEKFDQVMWVNVRGPSSCLGRWDGA